MRAEDLAPVGVAAMTVGPVVTTGAPDPTVTGAVCAVLVP